MLSLWTSLKLLTEYGILDSCTNFQVADSQCSAHPGWRVISPTALLLFVLVQLCHAPSQSPQEYHRDPTLGPYFFLVFINDLPQHVPVETELYADDALLHCVPDCCQSQPRSHHPLQSAITSAETWSNCWHGCFGHNKTKTNDYFLCISYLHTRDTASNGRKSRGHSLAHKHLGVTITSTLQGKCHVQDL